MAGRRRNKRENLKASITTQNSTSCPDDIDSWSEELEMEFKNRMVKFDNLLKKKKDAIECAYDFHIKKIPSHILNSKVRWINKENIEASVTEAPQRSEKENMSHRSSSVSSTGISSSVQSVNCSSSLGSLKKIMDQLISTHAKFRTPAYKGCLPSVPNLITPKMTLNTPLSVARYPQQGEVALSLQGSPLMVAPLVQNYRANANICLPDGKVLSILPEQGLKPRDIPHVDDETKRELLTLKQHIDAFINMAANVK